MPAPAAVATPANTATPAAPATNGATPPAAATTSATPAPETFFELNVRGEKKKLAKAEAEKLLSKYDNADAVTQKAKEELNRIAEERERYKAESAVWDDEAKLEAKLAERGDFLDRLARKRLEAKLAEHQMTPEQREAAQAKAERDALKKQLDDKAAAETKQRQDAANKVLADRMSAQLQDAAERAGLKQPGKAVSPDEFFAVYEAVKEFKKLGLPWDAERIIETAKENIDGGFRRLEGAVLKGLKGKALVERLGDLVVKEVLRYKAEELRGGGARPQAPAAAPKPQAPSQWMSPADLQAKYRAGGTR